MVLYFQDRGGENNMRNGFLSQGEHFCFFKPVSFLILISIISTGFFVSFNVAEAPPPPAPLKERKSTPLDPHHKFVSLLPASPLKKKEDEPF